MKKKVIGIALATVLVLSLGLVFAAPVGASPGIAGLWHLDEGSGTTAADSSGNGNDGVLRRGIALSFDGDDYVEVADDNSLDITGDLTIEAWVKLDTNSDLMYVASKDLSGQRSYGLFVDGRSAYNGEAGLIVFNDSGLHSTVRGDTTLNTGQWYHLAGTYEYVGAGTSVMKIYVDGSLDSSAVTDAVGPIKSGSANLQIGAREYVGQRQFFDGIIDEVRISDAVRTSFEACGVPAADDDTVGLWHLDGGGPGTAADASGNGNTGLFASSPHDPSWAPLGPTWATGVCEDALNFDGVDDCVCLPASNSIINTSTFTVEAWFKTSVNHPVYGSGTKEGRLVNLHKGSTASTAVSLYVEQDMIGLIYWNGSNHIFLKHTVDYHDNVWHHIAVTYDGTYRLYYDGTQVASQADSFGGFGSFPAYIGSFNCSERFFNGLIDEVRIWDEVRPDVCGPDLSPYPGRAYLSGITPCIVDATPVFVANPSGLDLGLNDYESDTEIRWFAEKQFVCVTGLSYDGGGSHTGRVNSYFVHQESEADGSSDPIRGRGCIEFPNDIIGIITNDAGLEATDGVLGLDDVTYSTLVVNRGLEMGSGRSYQDLVEIDGNVLKVDLQSAEKMDQIRVLTEAPMAISICPEDDVNPVTAMHMVTATIDPVLEGVVVNFEVTAGPNVGAMGSDTTGFLGKARFWYFGTGGTGTDDILAWIDMNCNRTYEEADDVEVETTKIWVDLVDLWPASGFNLVGEEHCVYADIGCDVDDFPVHFMVTGANFWMGPPKMTEDGVAEFCYVGNNPGKDTILAWLEVNGIPGYQPFGCLHDIGLTVEKYWLDHRVTGGGNITIGRGKNCTAKITFGGNVGIAGGDGLAGQYQINFHTVNKPLAEGNFHTTDITFLDFKWLFFCPDPDPPDDAVFNWAQFKADGTFNGDPGWSILVNVSDFGEGKNATDGIRILLYDCDTAHQDTTTPVYDSWAGAGGDFPAEWVCPTLYMFRHKLDGGNIQIHKID